MDSYAGRTPEDLAKTCFDDDSRGYFLRNLQIVKNTSGYVWHWDGLHGKDGGNNGKTTMAKALGGKPLGPTEVVVNYFIPHDKEMAELFSPYRSHINMEQIELYKYEGNLIIIYDSCTDSKPIRHFTDLSKKILVTRFERTFPQSQSRS